MARTVTREETACFHCGLACPADAPSFDDKKFCCRGCRAVYELLNENNLTTYYSLGLSPGRTPARDLVEDRFDFLDKQPLLGRMLDYDDGKKARVTLTIPQIHCASCIWLLENLARLHEGILASRVDFLTKNLSISFDRTKIPLSKLIELLTLVGYEPEINLDRLEPHRTEEKRGRLHRKIGVVGFCFGNIMLFSFPHYFGIDGLLAPAFYKLFSYLNAALSIPILIYGASDYLRSAVNGLRVRNINMDVPIAICILMLFGRSFYEIVFMGQQGYLDSFAGLVFFLLLGKLFQKKTFDAISFDRDYRSFFPLSTRTFRKGRETYVSITDLVVSDRIVIRNGELIPADSVLIEGTAEIDYSFVTGESEPMHREIGEMIYAGGRQRGGAILLEVIKEVSHSYLTRLWNEANTVLHPDEQLGSAGLSELADQVGKYFTLAVLSVAAITATYWAFVDGGAAINAATAVLIVACPCALALSTPFTFGTVMRILGRRGLYLKSAEVVEKIAGCDTIVMDKTGTLTTIEGANLEFVGVPLTEPEAAAIRYLVKHSTHPMSRKIYDGLAYAPDHLPVNDFTESAGKGLYGKVNESVVKVGTAEWSECETIDCKAATSSQVYIAINSIPRGTFKIKQAYRDGVGRMVARMKDEYQMALLSGDRDSEKQNLLELLGGDTEMHFRQLPHDKQKFVRKLRELKHRVIMLGDGLNDAAALTEANVGIAVSEEVSTFSPACDAVLDGKSFGWLYRMLSLSKKSMRVIKVSFAISFLYNVIGVSFAASGLLSPLVSAILMPVSSISVVLFATISTGWLARREGL